ncbi:hypothetical protein [Streptomyces sp. NPDC051738]|uniref:hypothetical protein n=1 Tax=Streptomyces sp. NPDC051738 TaxID=3365672 RepID=UPI0037D2EFEE
MSDELSDWLSELAASRATPPVVDGAGIRARAIRRRRRRRTAVTLGAGTAALALLGLALTSTLDGPADRSVRPQIPAADGATSGSTTGPTSGPAQSVPPSPGAPEPVAGTLLLSERTLTVDGRTLSALSGYDGSRRFAGPLTVVAKHASRDLAVGMPSKGPVDVAVPYVVELRDTRDKPLYVGSYTKPLALGEYKVTSDWLALDGGDAKWFYARIRVGDSIALTTATTPTATTPSATLSGRASEAGRGLGSESWR